MRRQLRALGLGHDAAPPHRHHRRRYYRWTQWIFLQIFNSWYDTDADRARPIAELVDELEAGARPTPRRRSRGPSSTPSSGAGVVDAHRLAYLGEAPVNWCPGLGTVLANEEVTADGRSERGNFPVYRRPLQAVDAAHHRLRRAAARRPRPPRLDRLDQGDAAQLDRAQRGGRGHASPVDAAGERAPSTCSRPGPTRCSAPPTWCSRPSTRWSTRSCPTRGPRTSPTRWTGGAATPGDAVVGVPAVGRCQDRARAQAEAGEDRRLHRRLRHQPGQRPADPDLHRRLRADGLRHRRDHGGARPGRARLGVRRAVRAARSSARCSRPTDWDGKAYLGDGPAINSGFLDGLTSPTPSARSSSGSRTRASASGTVTYKLRDWLFSRQRYWGEPFPIVYDETGLPIALPERCCRSCCPRSTTSSRAPADDDDDGARAAAVARRRLGRGRARPRRRAEALPARVEHDAAVGGLVLVLPALPRPDQRRRAGRPARSSAYWMGRSPGGVDLYVGGVEHAVLHLLYARFWHKVLFDLGHVAHGRAVPAALQPGLHPGRGLHRRARRYVEATEVEERDGGFCHGDEPVTREYGKMGKSLKNAVTPDEIYASTAPTPCASTRCHGSARRDRPWNTPPSSAAPLPATPVAQRRGRGDRRRSGSPTTRPTSATARAAAPHDRRRAARHGRPALQHRHRQASPSSTTTSPRRTPTAARRARSS